MASFLIVVGFCTLCGFLFLAGREYRRRLDLVEARLNGLEREFGRLAARTDEFHWDIFKLKASAGDPFAASVVTSMDYFKEHPGELYRFTHRVPPDACAIRCPCDNDLCWRIYCVQNGECGYLRDNPAREHQHADNDDPADCVQCGPLARMADLRLFRLRLRRAEESAEAAKVEPV